MKNIQKRIGGVRFLERLRAELLSGAYRPSPSRRKLIPKPGKPGKFRPLGIPTVKDRVVQAAVKQSWSRSSRRSSSVSYGFRPGRACHGALEHIRKAIRPHRRRRPTAGGAVRRISGSSKGTSRAASTTSITTMS